MQSNEFFSDKKPKIMGILNLSANSFYDGGVYSSPAKACEHFKKMVAEGADIIDIGAESSRPGSVGVPQDTECSQILEVLKLLPKFNTVKISIDTSRAETAAKALTMGVDIINDIYALRRDPALARVVAGAKCMIVLMHMQGTPETMQQNPVYDNVVDDIMNFFTERIDYALREGIEPSKIILDPGIGFGKNLDHNLEILSNIPKFKSLGFPVMIGASRKSFLGQLTGADVKDRLFGTAAVTAVLSACSGVDIFRVHDVFEMNEVVKVALALRLGIESREVAGV